MKTSAVEPCEVQVVVGRKKSHKGGRLAWIHTQTEEEVADNSTSETREMEPKGACITRPKETKSLDFIATQSVF